MWEIIKQKHLYCLFNKAMITLNKTEVTSLNPLLCGYVKKIKKIKIKLLLFFYL